jgi:hypothetical protein
LYLVFKVLLSMTALLYGDWTDTRPIEIFQDENGNLYYRFVTQERDNSAAQRAQEPEVMPQAGMTEQIRGTYMRGPSSGTRTNSITQRGGEAATQVCGGPLEIVNLDDDQCRELEYDRDFLQVFQTEGLTCFRQAAQAAFGFTPTRVRVKTYEGQVRPGRTSANGNFSTHSVGRALDLFEVDLYNGAAHNTVVMHGSYMDRQGHRIFYSGFTDCWRDVVDRMQAQGLAGSCGSGALDYNYDGAHWGHLHMSLPPLEANRRRYSLNCT